MEALDTQEDCKHSNKDKQMSIGRKKFNMDPKKGTNISFAFYHLFECGSMRLKTILDKCARTIEM